MRSILASMVLLALAGCASKGMDEAQCQTADWRAIGYEDGAKGYSADGFGRHRKACAEFGIAAKFDDYMVGHGEGLTGYCRPVNGYNLGLSGKRYGGICPVSQEAAFAAAHADGFGLYQRRTEMNRIGKELSWSKARAEKIEFLMVEKTARLVEPALIPTERAAIAIELKQLTEEKIDLEQSIRTLEIDYADAEAEYEAYREEIDRRYRG